MMAQQQFNNTNNNQKKRIEKKMSANCDSRSAILQEMQCLVHWKQKNVNTPTNQNVHFLSPVEKRSIFSPDPWKCQCFQLDLLYLPVQLKITAYFWVRYQKETFTNIYK